MEELLAIYVSTHTPHKINVHVQVILSVHCSVTSVTGACVVVFTFCSLDESVDLWHGDNVCEHVTQPLWIDKVEMA